jgi:hypothetical protein
MLAQPNRIRARCESAYTAACRLSTRYEREAASALMERLVDAGSSYAEAAATVRGRRVASLDAGAPVASLAARRTAVTHSRRRRRDNDPTATLGGRF